MFILRGQALCCPAFLQYSLNYYAVHIHRFTEEMNNKIDTGIETNSLQIPEFQQIPVANFVTVPCKTKIKKRREESLLTSICSG